MVYKLCYIKNNKAYFTSNWKEQWGDDWDNRPYEHNAEEPYYHYWKNNVEYPIKMKELYFELPCLYSEPCEGHVNSPYSVEDINNHRCPWLTIQTSNKTHYIFAGTSYTKFIKQIEELDGRIYLPKKKGVK